MKVIAIIFALVISAHAKSENVRNLKHEVRNYANLTRLEDILNLFNIDKIGSSWKELNTHVNRECSRDMTEYLNGLEEKKIWALKSKSFCCVFFRRESIISA
jgi:hypothetical protein